MGYIDELRAGVINQLIEIDKLKDRLEFLTGIKHVPEKTCRLNELDGMYYCSECDHMAQVFVCPKYCPNCGARVVE